MTKNQEPWLHLEALKQINDVLQKDICASDMLDEVEIIVTNALHSKEWLSIRTAPVDGSVITVRESSGTYGKARVMGRRKEAVGTRFEYIWIWEGMAGKAYPVEWRP